MKVTIRRSNSESDIKFIRSNFKSGSYAICFVSSVVSELNDVKENEDNQFIIPPWIFDVMKKIVLIKILYCFANESSYRQCIQRSGLLAIYLTCS